MRIPTPGVPGDEGGANSVNLSDGETIEVLSPGGPERTNVVVRLDGIASRISKSAGVILKRTRYGEASILLRGLNELVGSTPDHQGKTSYFTEVPTPGLPGRHGEVTRPPHIDPGPEWDSDLLQREQAHEQKALFGVARIVFRSHPVEQRLGEFAVRIKGSRTKPQGIGQATNLPDRVFGTPRRTHGKCRVMREERHTGSFVPPSAGHPTRRPAARFTLPSGYALW